MRNDPRWTYLKNMDTIRKAEQRLYQEEPGCACENPPCEDWKDHLAKREEFEQKVADDQIDREREKRAFNE